MPVAPPATTHSGIPFGPYHLPPESFSEFSGTLHTARTPERLLAALEAARRANARLFISFTGKETYNRDSNGFNLAIWKQRVDRFRVLDLTSYIADGTIAGHFIMDEPNDPSNWNGKRVPHAEVEAMAEYSKQVWPSMITMIRARTDYLQGHQYPHLDAIRIQYHSRLGPIEDFLTANIRAASELGLAVVGGLNVLNGGTSESGIPGHTEGRFAMSADQLRSWGGRYLSEPSLCAFLMWEYDSTYFSRPDIREAMAELAEKARSRPNTACRP
jgi:hypothetical protein